MKTGAQLYTVRAYTQTEKDFSRTMEKIAEMGYTTVQISAIGKEIRPERVRKICEENGLKIVLTHSDWNRILNDTDRLIEEHDILGCDHIGLGAMPEKYRTPEWIRYLRRTLRSRRGRSPRRESGSCIIITILNFRRSPFPAMRSRSASSNI